MVGQIVYLPEFIDFLNKLFFTLYKKEYFGFYDSAQDYIDEIYNYIESNILKNLDKVSPKELSHLGTFYITYQSNLRTTWYILFDKSDEEIIVTFIFNNHEKLAQYLEL